jgi:exopolysaccharide biosynthesis WecB/TagA/CpsF family protein
MSAVNRTVAFPVDDYDLDAFANVAAGFGQRSYGYVVTPNADHLIRWHQDADFRAYYADASYVLLDSRFLASLVRRMNGVRAPVCTGSDLTERILSRAVAPQDRIVLIGGAESQARKLEARYGLCNLQHFNPPMGFANDPAALETCLAFIERHSPFRYCLLAVGAPRQEMLAQALRTRGLARGLALCIGASIDYLTGKERRAPLWMQHLGAEWLFRLMQHPARLAHRYLVRGPRVFWLIPRTQLVLRPAIGAP